MEEICAPLNWTFTLHGVTNGPLATVTIPFQGTGAGMLQINFFSATIPADSFDPATKLAVKNLDRSTLGGVITAVNSAGTLTLTTTSSGQPPQVQHEIQFMSKAP
jgi:hypothetical protein